MKSTVGSVFALFIIVLLSASAVAAVPDFAKRGDSPGNPGMMDLGMGSPNMGGSGDTKPPNARGHGSGGPSGHPGIGSPDTECRSFGFDYGIAKWQARGNGFSPEGDAHATFVSGTPSYFEWDVGVSGAEGIIIKAGRDVHYAIHATSGTVEQDRPETSHVTFCGYDRPLDEPLTCQRALDTGLLSATLENGVAIVRNDAGESIDMNLVVYEMYSDNIEDQRLYDSESHTAPPGESTVSVNVPKDAYQADLVCGDILEWNPEYDDRVIAFEFGNQGDWATPTPTGDVTLSIAEHFPQDHPDGGTSYVFHCEADFTVESYHWYLGDEESHLNTADNKFYTYYDPGEYTVACIAVSDTDWGADTLDIDVE